MSALGDPRGPNEGPLASLNGGISGISTGIAAAMAAPSSNGSNNRSGSANSRMLSLATGGTLSSQPGHRRSSRISLNAPLETGPQQPLTQPPHQEQQHHYFQNTGFQGNAMGVRLLHRDINLQQTSVSGGIPSSGGVNGGSLTSAEASPPLDTASGSLLRMSRQGTSADRSLSLQRSRGTRVTLGAERHRSNSALGVGGKSSTELGGRLAQQPLQLREDTALVSSLPTSSRCMRRPTLRCQGTQRRERNANLSASDTVAKEKKESWRSVAEQKRQEAHRAQEALRADQRQLEGRQAQLLEKEETIDVRRRIHDAAIVIAAVVARICRAPHAAVYSFG
ncbi:hypothetical protein cyc_03489 [Cyclospora cayetanensis]|uniref:Uncharacterized protein n=1 Tax=Cyclospora cayetanensis TaxID=88456 RepID=A0A1D3DB23_9EIME|nr:hypothetical protein cyc_03489 [Cyclospora cayetanensis]